MRWGWIRESLRLRFSRLGELNRLVLRLANKVCGGRLVVEASSLQCGIQRFLAGVYALWVYDYFLTLSDEVNPLPIPAARVV